MTKIFAVPPEIPVWPPHDPETLALLTEIYSSQKWSFMGQYEQLFNEKFATYHKVAHSVLMANGTVTLECALRVLGIGPGDEVIVPACTWIATAMAVLYVGATPVIADVEPHTLCLDPSALAAAITARTKAVIPVHLYGSLADMDQIMIIARQNGLKVIEDCAHVHGAFWDGKGVGSIGDIGSFSFQQSKLMTSGEGGSITTNDPHLAENLLMASHIGYRLGTQQGVPGAPPPEGLDCRNYRITEFQAAILLGQLAHLEKNTRQRAESMRILTEGVANVAGITVQAPGRRATVQAYYSPTLLLDPALDRNAVIADLQTEGFSCSKSWGGIVCAQRLWNVSPERYRIDSADVGLEATDKRIIVFPHAWLLADRSVMENVLECIRKVLKNYA